mmetsp:Transcript_31914/g.78090  ORF Transcript_31914/g.78090 Transcript_31914/m.78090 type:complete len:179 (+) Transcript_31914:67-603(+)
MTAAYVDDVELSRELEAAASDVPMAGAVGKVHGGGGDDSADASVRTRLAQASVSEEMETIVLTESQALYIYLKRLGFATKLVAVIDFLFAFARIWTPGAWWLGMALIFAPIGFYGAYKFKRPYILVYMLYSAAQVVLYIWYMSRVVNINAALALYGAQALMQCVIIYYLYHFWLKLPA